MVGPVAPLVVGILWVSPTDRLDGHEGRTTVLKRRSGGGLLHASTSIILFPLSTPLIDAGHNGLVVCETGVNI